MVPFGLLSPCLACPELLARVLALAARVRRQALPKAGLPLLVVASRRTMLSFCEAHGLRVPSATKRDEKGPCALRELTTPWKRQDSDTDLSS